MYDKPWTKLSRSTSEKPVYSIEASTLGTPPGRHPLDVCPHCSKLFVCGPDEAIVNRGEDAELTHWSLNHECGAELIIFND